MVYPNSDTPQPYQMDNGWRAYGTPPSNNNAPKPHPGFQMRREMISETQSEKARILNSGFSRDSLNSNPRSTVHLAQTRSHMNARDPSFVNKSSSNFEGTSHDKNQHFELHYPQSNYENYGYIPENDQEDDEFVVLGEDDLNQGNCSSNDNKKQSKSSNSKKGDEEIGRVEDFKMVDHTNANPPLSKSSKDKKSGSRSSGLSKKDRTWKMLIKKS